MEAELNLTLLSERLTAFQISRAVAIDERTAQRIIENDINLDDLEPHIISQLKDLNDKLMG